MSPFWILLELRIVEVVMTTGAVRHVNPQSSCHHQQTNTQLFTGQTTFLLPNQQCQSTEEKSVTFHGLSQAKLLVSPKPVASNVLLPNIVLPAGCPSCRPTNNVRALKGDILCNLNIRIM